MFGTPAFLTAFHIAFASRTSLASGFSHRIALPAWAAAIAISAWLSPGVAMSTMSMSGRATTSRQSVAHSSQPSWAAARFTFARSRPQTTLSRGVSFGGRKRLTCRQALLWARPMKA